MLGKNPLLAILTGLVTGLLEDRLNARAAKARLLPGTEHAATVFDEDGYTMTTGVTETRWQYAQILAIAETKRYFILALSKNHAQAVNKEGMQGGSAEEFRAFITEKTGKPVTYIKK